VRVDQGRGSMSQKDPGESHAHFVTILQVLGSVEKTRTVRPSSCCRVSDHAHRLVHQMAELLLQDKLPCNPNPNPSPKPSPASRRARAHVHQEICAMLSVQLASSLISSLPDRHAAMLQRQDRYCGRARAPAVSPGALEQGLLCWLRNSLGCRWVTHRAPPETATSLAKHTGPTQGRHANFACGACMAWKACAGGAALRRRQAWARLRGHHEADEAVVALRVLEAHLVLRARAKRACENTTFRCAARILHKLASAHAARA